MYFLSFSVLFKIVVLFINCISLFSSIILHFTLLSNAYFSTWILPNTWSILVPIPPIITISSLCNSTANLIAISVSVLSLIGLNLCILIKVSSLYKSKISFFTVSKSPTIWFGLIFSSFNILTPLSTAIIISNFFLSIVSIKNFFLHSHL